jgi:hypothetical protein
MYRLHRLFQLNLLQLKEPFLSTTVTMLLFHYVHYSPKFKRTSKCRPPFHCFLLYKGKLKEKYEYVRRTVFIYKYSVPSLQFSRPLRPHNTVPQCTRKHYFYSEIHTAAMVVCHSILVDSVALILVIPLHI